MINQGFPFFFRLYRSIIWWWKGEELLEEPAWNFTLYSKVARSLSLKIVLLELLSDTVFHRVYLKEEVDTLHDGNEGDDIS